MTDKEIEMVQRQVAELVGSAMRSMRAELMARYQSELNRLTTRRPLSELTEADGHVLLWFGSMCAGMLRIADRDMFDLPGAAWTPLPRVKPTVAEDAQQRGIAYDLSRAAETAPATPPPTVGDLAETPEFSSGAAVVEFSSRGRVYQLFCDRHREWTPSGWSELRFTDSDDALRWMLRPARLVYADKANESPDTRGPL